MTGDACVVGIPAGGAMRRFTGMADGRAEFLPPGKWGNAYVLVESRAWRAMFPRLRHGLLLPRATDKTRVPVKFYLIDKVHTATPQRIVALKNVTLAEEYLADHFPSFPVLPGVMMLEALTQAAAWLLHLGSDFSKSMAVLKEARNLRYGNFVAPGSTLQLEVELIKPTPGGATFKAVGSIDGQQALTGRLEMSYFNLTDTQPTRAEADRLIIEHTKRRWAALQPQIPVSI